MSRGLTLKANERNMVDFDSIISESHQLGRRVYDKVQEGEDNALSKEYLNEFVPVAKRRLILSGHRLALIIRKLFKTYIGIS